MIYMYNRRSVLQCWAVRVCVVHSAVSFEPVGFQFWFNDAIFRLQLIFSSTTIPLDALFLKRSTDYCYLPYLIPLNTDWWKSEVKILTRCYKVRKNPKIEWLHSEESSRSDFRWTMKSSVSRSRTWNTIRRKNRKYDFCIVLTCWDSHQCMIFIVFDTVTANNECDTMSCGFRYHFLFEKKGPAPMWKGNSRTLFFNATTTTWTRQNLRRNEIPKKKL